MIEKTILITGCGGHFIKDTIKCYRNSGKIKLNIIGTASEPDESVKPLLDKYFEVPKSTESGYFESILKICRDNSVDIVIPNVDEEIVLFCRNRSRFFQIGTILSAPSAESAEIVTDKAKFAEFARKENIPHPKTFSFQSLTGFIGAATKLGYPDKPFCIKLCGRAGSIGFRIIDPEINPFYIYENEKPTLRYMTMLAVTEMLSSAESLPRMIAQELLCGTEYSIDMVADHGSVLCMVGRENSVCENSIPLVSELKYNEAAYEISREIVRKLNLDGNIGIDFIINEEKGPVPIDVNARITSSISLCAAGGANLAFMQIERLLGLDISDVQIRYGTKMIRERIPVYSHGGGQAWRM